MTLNRYLSVAILLLLMAMLVTVILAPQRPHNGSRISLIQGPPPRPPGGGQGQGPPSGGRPGPPPQQRPPPPPPPPRDGDQGRRDRDRNPQLVQLGRELFFDASLSNPAGMSCSSCHSPEAGFSFPNSRVNEETGIAQGAVPARFGNRKPPTVSYAWFVLRGPPFFDRREQAWVGGLFLDGRARDMREQAAGPFLNPNEMNDTIHGVGSPAMVVQKVVSGKSAALFRQVFGSDALSRSADDAFRDIARALDAYERSAEVSPFNSRYDAYLTGRARLSPSELNGLKLFTGSATGRPGGPSFSKSAQCITCHTLDAGPDHPPDRDPGRGPGRGLARDHGLFTNFTYANIGVPKNPNNPYYKQTDPTSNPQGYNPLGAAYIDFGLGDTLYKRDNLPPGNAGPGSDGRGDYLAVNGMFRVPTLRNVDKRSSPAFVKSYMHNGVFKSLKQVVHFYNTRNLTSVPGEVIDFTSQNPYAALKGKPLWPAPEYPSAATLQNPAGRPNSRADRIGNLGLTDQEENDLVAFLQTLSDGYFAR